MMKRCILGAVISIVVFIIIKIKCEECSNCFVDLNLLRFNLYYTVIVLKIILVGQCNEAI